MLGPVRMDARTAESPVTFQQESWLRRERASGRFYERMFIIISLVMAGILGLTALLS